MTSIEWLIKELRMEMGCGKDLCKSYQGVYEEIINEAKEMHKQEMKEMYLKGIENYDPTFKRKDDTLNDYHIVDTNEMVEFPQQEISDDEIHKAATNYSALYYEFRAGAKWYREQLKQRQ